MKVKVGRVAKLVVAGLTAAVVGLNEAFGDNLLEANEVVSVILAVLGVYGVYRVPNTPDEVRR